MKKVLYITNKEVPYRVSFFNLLSEKCDLTVLYESPQSISRNEAWAKSVKRIHNTEYLRKNEKDLLFLLRLFKFVTRKYDMIIIGCYNSKIQMLMILLYKIFRIKYCINLDGETFLSTNGIKSFGKKWVLKGANYYFVAGKSASNSLEKIVDKKYIIPYPFSSLTQKEIEKNELLSLRRANMK